VGQGGVVGVGWLRGWGARACINISNRISSVCVGNTWVYLFEYLSTCINILGRLQVGGVREVGWGGDSLASINILNRFQVGEEMHWYVKCIITLSFRL
jgi:hypothetical protein